MNKISFKHPQSKEIRTTRDFMTARALMAAGWQVVPNPVTVIVRESEAKK